MAFRKQKSNTTAIYFYIKNFASFSYFELEEKLKMVEIAKGTYERYYEENVEEVMRALNMNYILRKAATISTPRMEISEGDGGVWTIKTSTTLKTMELTFRVGDPFDYVTVDGRNVSSLVTVEENKFICVQTAKDENEKSTKTIRDFTEHECITTMEIIGTDIACVQKFKRV